MAGRGWWRKNEFHAMFNLKMKMSLAKVKEYAIRGRSFLSWLVLLGSHFINFASFFKNLFAYEQKNGPSFRCWNMRIQILVLPCLLNPKKCLLPNLFVKKSIYGHLSKSIFFHGEAIIMCIRLPHTLLHFIFWGHIWSYLGRGTRATLVYQYRKTLYT